MTNRASLRLLLLAALALWVCPAIVAASNSSGEDEDSSDASSVRGVTSMDLYDGLAILFMACGLVVSSAGGIGGGSIMVPAMVIIMGFNIKVATPISNMGILGGALANTIFNLTKRHPAYPSVDRPLIDADLSLMTIPLVIGGAVIGTVLSNLMPAYIISILFLPFLGASGSRMLIKGLQLQRKERAARKIHQFDQQPSPSADYLSATTPTVNNDPTTRTQRVPHDEDKLRSLSSHSSEISLRVVPQTEFYQQQANSETVALIVERERQFPWLKHAAILVCYLVIVAVSIGDALVACGGVAYWLLLIIELPVVIAFAAVCSVYLYRQDQRKMEVGYPFADGDVHWTKKIVTLFPLGSAAAGIVAGLFGIGGVLITGPIMVELGVIPEVLAAASALMVLYSSAAAAAKYAVFNMIAWDWAFLLCALSFVVTSCSQVFIVAYVRRTGKQSILVLCIAATLLLAMVLMAYDAVRSTIDEAGDSFTIDFCS